MSVYFFTCRAANAVKIGTSVDPHGRLPEIQRGCPLPVILEAALPGHHRVLYRHRAAELKLLAKLRAEAKLPSPLA